MRNKTVLSQAHSGDNNQIRSRKILLLIRLIF